GPAAPAAPARAGVTAALVIPNHNGRRWIAGCLDSVHAQTRAPDEVVVVDNGSTDGSGALAAARDGVRVVSLGRNLGFAAAANRGIAETTADAVALVNTDVVLAEDWLERVTGALDEGVGSVASKMVSLDDPAVLYDAGDVLRRDGVCEQRGRFARDDGRFDAPGEVFAACAGAALYRRSAVEEVGGFDERFFLYLEDVDLGLRLRLAGWSCRWEPRAVARHAGEGSAGPRSPAHWAQRNTLLLGAKAFPARWAGPFLYRQGAWAWHAAREGRLREHLRASAAAIPLLPAMLRERRRLRAAAAVPISRVVPRRPYRGPVAADHPRARDAAPPAGGQDGVLPDAGGDG
ncbi:MAG TPA: glycosyltransferase family 2 protein, partial [Solirubrobacteraceae bacterium]|nr:glycosyltransferase family 2 protein [Solirubrobacteraceae bacterium]